MRIIFAGTPDFAARHLTALIEADDIDVVAVYTQPDRPAGRGKKLQASAVKQLALTHNLPVLQPVSLKTAEAQAQLAEFAADIMVVVAYGLILPAPVLNLPRLGCVNVHGSLLPRWRGAAPIQRAIWAGDNETGVTIMQMDEGLDTGPMLAKSRLTITDDDTSASLYEKLAKLGPIALVETLRRMHMGDTYAAPQEDSKTTYAKKLSKEEGSIDWHQSAEFIERCVRAFNPWPGSTFLVPEHPEQPFKVWQASVVDNPTQAPAGTIIAVGKMGIDIACGEGALRLIEVQPAGKKPMAVADLLNARGDWFTPGTNLHCPSANGAGS